MDKKFCYNTYQVSYKAKIGFDNKGDKERHSISRVHSELPACFSNILGYIPYSLKDKTIDLDMNIIFKNTYNKDGVVFPNRTFFSTDQIKFWLGYISSLFNTDITLISSEEDNIITYDVHINVSKNKAQIIMILTLIRFLYEHPYSFCIYLAMQYKDKYPDLSLLYVLNCLFTIYNTIVNIPCGHYYNQGNAIPKNINDNEYKAILDKKLQDGYAYCNEWSYQNIYGNKAHQLIMNKIREIINKTNKNNKNAICWSYDSLFNGEAYNLFVKPLDYLINATN